MAEQDQDNAKKAYKQQVLTESIGNIVPTPIADKMQESYLEYAMSVIISRALPDVRDGLKPVHRRILYTMHQMGLQHKAKYQKCAKVVGQVMGLYHPHGDFAIYDTLVRMAQDFAMRYQLVDGQGNFGSVDGDSAAAMRYTECKMKAISDELLADINKQTVPFIENYDGTEEEPAVLPSRIPALLVNGSSGIAVGMATNIPPHNLNEVIDAIAYLIDNPEARIEDLMQFIKGPDFPTGGFIYSNEDILNAYISGKGSVTMRARTAIEELHAGKNAIIVTELPYQVNKASLIERIADLTRDKKIKGISDLRDESDRHGMRIVIELKRDAIPKVVLNQLFKHTQLQLNFNFNLVALVDGKQPKLMHLRHILKYFIEHRREVIVKRTEFELTEAQDRLHILEGLRTAIDNIDDVIATIRASDSSEEAKINLIERFNLSDKQATAILEMQLRRLAALERQKIEDEYNAILALVTQLQDILANPKKILSIIKKELVEISEKYGDERKTTVVPNAIGDFNEEDLITKEDVYVTLTHDGYVKRLQLNTYKQQGRGGKGIIGMPTKEEDVVEHLLVCSSHSNLLFFTNRGRVFKLKAYELPEASRTAKGQNIINLLQITQDETVQSVLSVEDMHAEGNYLFFGTKNGVVKKTALRDFANIRANGIIAINLRENDEVRSVRLTDGSQEIIMITEGGLSIRFHEQDVRAMGRSSEGVMGIRLQPKDQVVSMAPVDKTVKTEYVCIISTHGYGKKTLVTQYPLQRRGGKGVKTAKPTPKTGKIASFIMLNNESEDLVIVSQSGQVIRLPVSQVSTLTRATQGVRLMRLNNDDLVATVSVLA